MSHVLVLINREENDFSILFFEIFNDVIAPCQDTKFNIWPKISVVWVLEYIWAKFQVCGWCEGALINSTKTPRFSTFGKSFDILDHKFSRNEDMTLAIIFDVLSHKTKKFENPIFQISLNEFWTRNIFQIVTGKSPLA